MESVKNLLEFLNQNWTAVLICIGCIVSIATKTKNWLSKSGEERLEITKAQIRETMLKLITDAEVDYETWNAAGSIKRSQVIGVIYEKYPMLSKVANQEEIIAWIDTEINESLKTLRELVKQRKVTE